MGGCCSQLQSNAAPRVSEKQLRDRQRMQSPAEKHAERIIGDRQKWAHSQFLTAAQTAISGDSPVLATRHFGEVLHSAEIDAVHYFRTQFLQGTDGESVPFDQILAGEIALSRLCQQDRDFFSYCNSYRSYIKCATVKRKLVEKGLFAGKSAKKLLRLYDGEAEGPYSSLCRADLIGLIGEFTGENREYIEEELEKQSRADRETLRRDRARAEAVSQRAVPEMFRSGKDSSELNPTLKSCIAVLGLPSRLPETDEFPALRIEEASGGSFCTVEFASVSPVHKRKLITDCPFPVPESCSAQKVPKLSPEDTEDTEPN